MKITALDIHQKEFSHSMRGYRENEVDDFLDACAQEVDRLTKELAVVSARATEVEAKMNSLESERGQINSALLIAQRSADEMLAKTEVHCRNLVDEAETRATDLVHQALAGKQELLAEIKRLKDDEVSFRDSYRAMLESSLIAITEVPLSAGIIDAIAHEPLEMVDAREVAAAVVPEFVPEIEPEPEPEPEFEPVVEETLFAEELAQPVPAPVMDRKVVLEPVVDAEGRPLQSFIIGETASQAPIDTTLEEPEEFKGSAFAGWGDREDDLEIEEID